MKKCEKCGAMWPDNMGFCPDCGNKLDNTSSENQHDEEASAFAENSYDETDGFSNEKRAKKTGRRKSSLWDRLDAYGRIASLSIAFFCILCLSAFLFNKPIAGIIAVAQIVIVAVALFIKKSKPQTHRQWIHILLLVIAIVLLVPYVLVCSASSRAAKRYDWSIIALNDIIPQPQSNVGKIISNTETSLTLYVYKTSASQYSSYANSCQEMGFTVELETDSTSFSAFNDSGYELSLSYRQGKSEMDIRLNAATQYGDLKWPDSGLATMLPEPPSSTGKIVTSSDTSFSAYVSEMSKDSYADYVKDCETAGFTVDASEGEKTYSAKNEDGYRLSLSYEGNNVIYISLQEPTYDISITIDCEKNLIFSQYDVKIYVDDTYLGQVDHGTMKTFTKSLPQGNYILKFVDADDDSVTGNTSINVSADASFQYQISCTATKINVTSVSDDSTNSGTSNSASDSDEAEAEDESSQTDDSETETDANTDDAEDAETQPTADNAEESPETEAEDDQSSSVSYSTNSKDTVKDGNSGVYAYKSRGGVYDSYWVIDLDEGYVYFFSEGNSNELCDRVPIVSGDLNSVVIITYHDGSDTFSYGLHFKYVNFPDHLICQDEDGFEYDYYTTNLESALSIRAKKTMVDY